ncbi:energy transducer TonB, partial [Zoogloea sp.]|uniref:energy transducer TonB n=1 Tax=Zoogloea sp. TaxID=49181 RepID=UPI0035AF5A50
PTLAPAASPAVDSVAPHAPVARAEALAPSAPAADEAPDPAQLERYGRSLSSALARQQNYPRLAALRGWEGEVQLRVTIARKGNVIATQVVRSSGFEILDQNAVQLIAAAGPLPRPPESLQNREIQVIVPVHYKLEKPT